MDSKGKKALLALTMVVMLAAVGFIIYASRQAAEAQDNPSTRAAQIDRAAEEIERLSRR